jgi:hypothetical protein
MSEAIEHRQYGATFLSTGLVLLGLGLVGALLVLPYVASMEGKALSAVAIKKGMSIAALLGISVAQTTFLLSVAVFGGLWAARKLELGAPLIDAWLSHGALPRRLGLTLLFAVVAGLVTALVIYALDRWVFEPLTPIAGLRGAAQPADWKGLLASFYGALDEEILVRLGLLSLLALLLRTVVRLFGAGRSSALSFGVFWAANAITAVIFGLGHLPATAALAPLTSVLVTRVIVLNGFGGLVFGLLYKRFGLEWAMLSHFSADIVLHAMFGGG